MANIGTNLGNAVNDIIRWLIAAVKKAATLIHAGDTQNAVLLLADIQDVVTTYLEVIKQFLPSQAIESPPKGNLLKQLVWLLKNIATLQLLLVLLGGVNPFEVAKTKAREVAVRWGFAGNIYIT